MENPTFHLEGVVKTRDEDRDFEGPLSLILMLLSKNKIEIADIRISEILDQYLGYLSRMESMDLEIASEFVQMAAYLLYIKTKTLLKGDDEVSELEQLKESLEQQRCREALQAVRAVIPAMAAASEEGLLLFTRQQEPVSRAACAYAYEHDPSELVQTIWSMLSRPGAKIPPPPELRTIAPSRIVYGVREKSREIIDFLRYGPASLRSLYLSGRSRSEVVATFLSVLELCEKGTVAIDESGDDFIVSFVGGDIEEILGDIDD